MTGLREYIRDQNKKAVQIAIGEKSFHLIEFFHKIHVHSLGSV